MKFFLYLACATLLLVVTEAALSKQLGSLKADDLLGNKRLLQIYIDCILEVSKRPCPKLADELKANIKEALETDCGQCSRSQRVEIEKALSHFINKDRDTWNKLNNKFDPEGRYRETYERRLLARVN